MIRARGMRRSAGPGLPATFRVAWSKSAGDGCNVEIGRRRYDNGRTTLGCQAGRGSLRIQGGDADDRAAAALANQAGTAPFRSWSKCPTASRQHSVPGRHPGGIRQTRLSMIPGAGDAIRHDGRGGARSALRTVCRLCGSLVAHCQRRRREWRMRRSAGFRCPVLPNPAYGLQRGSAALLE